MQITKPAPYEQDTPGSARPGLGITYADIDGSRSVDSATATAVLSPESFTPPSTLSSPIATTRTLSGSNKQLPRPPVPSPTTNMLPSTPPLTDARPQRNNTLRSLAESIISSYAKRRMPESDSHDAFQTSSAHCEPAKLYDIPSMARMWSLQTAPVHRSPR